MKETCSELARERLVCFAFTKQTRLFLSTKHLFSVQLSLSVVRTARIASYPSFLQRSLTIHPAQTKQLFLELLLHDYDLYSSVIPSPCFVLHRKGDSCLKCFPCSVGITTSGPRASLRLSSPLWQSCDCIVFHEPCSNSTWLVPITSIPRSASITLGPSYEVYRLVLRPLKDSILTNELDAILKHAAEASTKENEQCSQEEQI